MPNESTNAPSPSIRTLRTFLAVKFRIQILCLALKDKKKKYVGRDESVKKIKIQGKIIVLLP